MSGPYRTTFDYLTWDIIEGFSFVSCKMSEMKVQMKNGEFKQIKNIKGRNMSFYLFAEFMPSFIKPVNFLSPVRV